MNIFLILIATITAVLAIDQSCPCPTNSQCLSNGMCACDAGWIGSCSTSAQILDAAPITVQLTQNKVSYLQIDPIQLDHYL